MHVQSGRQQARSGWQNRRWLGGHLHARGSGWQSRSREQFYFILVLETLIFVLIINKYTFYIYVYECIIYSLLYVFQKCKNNANVSSACFEDIPAWQCDRHRQVREGMSKWRERENMLHESCLWCYSN